MAYQVRYTIELYKRLKNRENFSDIKNSYQKRWVKNYIEKGKKKQRTPIQTGGMNE